MTDRRNHANQQSHPKNDPGAADDDAALEALFEAARKGVHDAPEVLPERLFTAILADAAFIQAERAQAGQNPPMRDAVPVTKPQNTRGAWGGIFAALGGWGTVSGLVAASCTGLWVGFVAPDALMSAPGLSALTAVEADVDDTTYETFDLASILVEDMQ